MILCCYNSVINIYASKPATEMQLELGVRVPATWQVVWEGGGHRAINFVIDTC